MTLKETQQQIVSEAVKAFRESVHLVAEGVICPKCRTVYPSHPPESDNPFTLNTHCPKDQEELLLPEQMFKLDAEKQLTDQLNQAMRKAAGKENERIKIILNHLMTTPNPELTPIENNFYITKKDVEKYVLPTLTNPPLK